MFAKLLFNHIERQVDLSVSFNPRQCLRSRLSTHSCDICLSQCENQAIDLRGKNIICREDICTRCMACVSACPNDAFDCDFDISKVFNALRFNNNKEPVVLACQKQSTLANQITIPCIGFFSEPLLAALNCVSSQEFYLDVGHCGDCENGSMLKLLQERMQAVRANAGQMVEFKLRYRTDNVDDSEDIGSQRRSFLRAAKKTFLGLGREVTAKNVPGKKMEPIGIKEKGPALTSRLLQMTLDLQNGDNHHEKKLLLSYFYTITANEKCTLCPSCTGMCPTGALKRKNIGGKKKLTFTSSKCSGCGLCLDFCKEQALSLRKGCEDNLYDERVINITPSQKTSVAV